MSVTAILEQARTFGIKVTREGNDLCVRGPKETLRQLAPALREHKPEILVALADPRPDHEASSSWLLVDKSGLSRLPFTKPKTRSEVEQKHPGCLVIRLPDSALERELLDLVARVAVREEFTAAELEEALTHARADPQSALRSFRLLAAESHR